MKLRALDQLPARHGRRHRHPRRFLHHAEVVVLGGDSYRLREARSSRQTRSSDPAALVSLVTVALVAAVR